VIPSLRSGEENWRWAFLQEGEMFCSLHRLSERETSHRPLSHGLWETAEVWTLTGWTQRTISGPLPKDESEIPAVLEVVGLQRLVLKAVWTCRDVTTG